MIRQVTKMQSFIAILIGSLLLFGFLLISQTAYAGDLGPRPPVVTDPIDRGFYSDQFNRPGFAPTYDPVTGTYGGGTTGGGAAAPEETQTQTTEVPTVQFANPLYQWLYEFVYSVFTTLFSFAGYLMTFGINSFLLGFGDRYYNDGIGFAVEEVWRIIRDLFNLTFIFGLVYIGFKMILDSSDSRARSMLVSLIGAALLVNFSLFITKFIIDLSHVASSVIADGFGEARGDIANAFINILNLETTLEISQGQITAFGNGGALAYIFGLMIFLATATFVFAAGGILLIIRFIALNVYMVFSPVMFLGWVFPAFSGTSSKFWTGFLKQAFFAPAYLLMLYLSFRVLYAYSTRPGAQSYAAMFSPDPATSQSALAVLPFFIMAMVFLVMSLSVARSMGAVGASTAISMGNTLRKNTQGVLYRNTGGRASKLGLNIMDRTGMSNLPGTRSLRNGLKSGYEYGAGGTGLAKTRSEIESEKADVTKNRSRMQGIKDTKKGRAAVKDTDKNRPELERLRSLAANPATYAGMSADDRSKLVSLEGEEAKAKQYITGLSKSDIEDLDSKTRAKYASSFTTDQTSKLMDSEKISSSEKGGIAGARKTAVGNKIGGIATPSPSKTSKLTRDELDTLGVEWVSTNSHLLSATQLDDWTKNSKKTTPELNDSIKQNKKSRILDLIQSPGGGADAILTELAKKPKEFIQLPKEVFLDASYSSAYPKISSGILEEIAKEGTLDQAQRFQLRQVFEFNAARWGIQPGVLAYFRSEEGKKKYGP